MCLDFIDDNESLTGAMSTQMHKVVKNLNEKGNRIYFNTLTNVGQKQQNLGTQMSNYAELYKPQAKYSLFVSLLRKFRCFIVDKLLSLAQYNYIQPL